MQKYPTPVNLIEFSFLTIDRIEVPLTIDGWSFMDKSHVVQNKKSILYFKFFVLTFNFDFCIFLSFQPFYLTILLDALQSSGYKTSLFFQMHGCTPPEIILETSGIFINNLQKIHVSSQKSINIFFKRKHKFWSSFHVKISLLELLVQSF